MKPLRAQDGGAMRKGTANEEEIIKTLSKYVYAFSGGKYKAEFIRILGLCVRRDVNSCSTSVDGIFALMERQDDGSYKFVGVCVLEIKTQSALGTIDAVYRQSLNGKQFVECFTGTVLFKTSVSDPPYRSQVCQHATAIDVEFVLIVYSLPGALPQKWF